VYDMFYLLIFWFSFSCILLPGFGPVLEQSRKKVGGFLGLDPAVVERGVGFSHDDFILNPEPEYLVM